MKKSLCLTATFVLFMGLTLGLQSEAHEEGPQPIAPMKLAHEEGPQPISKNV